ncbi:Carboxyl-terminal-processing protease [Hyella patelloides LEGE 07179]|uniref:Carboxyl-terminal-processing protease n=1 Tax=Hyella patelloides LEGE 07179 TaxID=945734 RepID=A0A563VXF4_9CYAN|nr:carboxyl-terminal processing protease CtpB [Hyella patelloides]VEP16119.1 Carboxyl-terminal-processing protease [Hyella patelloides LEGE 07179]
MNQTSRRSIFSRMMTAKFFTTAIATSALMMYTGSSVKAALEDSPKTLVDEVWQLVNNEFVDRKFNQVDWLQQRQELLSKEYADSQAAYKAIGDSLKTLGDPYTRFLDPEEFAELTSQTSGELSGIGIRLSFDEKTSELIVVEPITNSPAEKAGIKEGDKILAIDGKPTSLMSLEQASKQIKGEVGTEINLQISRLGAEATRTFDLTLVREQIELPSVDYNLSEAGRTRVGYIKLDEFSSHAAEQMEKAIEDLNSKEVTGFVLDLRGNPGGLLFSSVEIARMWLEKGAIVSTIDRKGGNQKFSANGKALTDLPLVILVDRYSASASEILAGALKENGRATIVGTRTYGKGTVQSVHSLSNGSGLAVTIARYYPPSGQDINYKGIAPDINIDLTAEQQMTFNVNPTLWGTEADPQYAKALQILQQGTSVGNIRQTPNPITAR